MIAERTVTLVMPCYNEEEGVKQVIESLPDGIDEIVVVDNNCTDRTAEVASALGARVIPEPRRGYGAAYKAGAACPLLRTSLSRSSQSGFSGSCRMTWK